MIFSLETKARERFVCDRSVDGFLIEINPSVRAVHKKQELEK